MCLPFDLKASIRFGSSGLRCFNSCELGSPEVIPPKNSDLAPPISFDDGRSLIASGIQDFDKSDLLRVHNVKARALSFGSNGC